MQLLDIWEEGQHAALLDDSTAGIRSRIVRAACVSDKTDYSAFNLKVLNDKLWAKVRGVCGQG